jgi:hypothetical protein
VPGRRKIIACSSLSYRLSFDRSRDSLIALAYENTNGYFHLPRRLLRNPFVHPSTAQGPPRVLSEEGKKGRLEIVEDSPFAAERVGVLRSLFEAGNMRVRSCVVLWLNPPKNSLINSDET